MARTRGEQPCAFAFSSTAQPGWSIDLVHEQITTGRRIRVLNVVDDVLREYLAAISDASISGERAVREVTDLIAVCGNPGLIVSDNGTELTSKAVLEYWREAGIE